MFYSMPPAMGNKGGFKFNQTRALYGQGNHALMKGPIMKTLNSFAQWLGLDNIWQALIIPPLFWALFYWGFAIATALDNPPV